jgi:hypothetical protein
MEGTAPERGDQNLSRPDAETVIKQERRDRVEDQRGQDTQGSDVPVPPEQQP